MQYRVRITATKGTQRQECDRVILAESRAHALSLGAALLGLDNTWEIQEQSATPLAKVAAKSS